MEKLWYTPFLTLVLDKSWAAGTYRIGDWAGPRASLDDVE
jgi:hypothetical protein